MKNLIISFIFLWLPFCMNAQKTISGYVFDDMNQNLQKEISEKGIGGVSVTNGVDVVRTDSSGYYTIPVYSDMIISVIKPSHYDLPKNKYNLPLFYFIHKPGGSPDLKYKGVHPTGELPETVNFPLIQSKLSDRFSALVFGDPQPYNQEEMNFFEKGIVDELIGISNVSFGLSLGDLVGDDLSLFEPYRNVIKKVGIPWFNVIGNHDLNFDVKKDEHADETFEACFGPSNFAFNYGKVHFIILDDILYPDPRDSSGYWGGFRKDQLDFVKNDLAFVPKDHLIVLAFHIPLFDEFPGDSFRDEDRILLFELLKEFPNTLSLSAHTHLQRQDFFYTKDGWHQQKPHHHFNVGTTSGDWYKGKLNTKGIPESTMRDGTPKGYVFIEFDQHQYEIRYKVAGKESNYQMEIFAPNVVEKDVRTSAGIFVNFFIGNEKSILRYRIDDGPWNLMNYMEEYDPSYLLEMFEWDTSTELLNGKRPSNPQKCKHLWRANIPTNLSEGTHILEIEATDIFGKKYNTIKKYKIQSKQ